MKVVQSWILKIERKFGQTQNSGVVWANRSFETYILAKRLKEAT